MNPKTIKIAVASDDDRGLDARVGQHFGRCAAYTLVDVAGGAIDSSQVVDNPFAHGHAPGDVPRFIAGTEANVLLAGGIGQRAIAFFDECGVRVSAGHTGTVRDAVDAWLGGTAGGAQPCAGHDHEGEHGHGHSHHGGEGCGRVS